MVGIVTGVKDSAGLVLGGRVLTSMLGIGRVRTSAAMAEDLLGIFGAG